MIKFNQNQKLELSKAIFNFGNILGGTLIVNEAVSGNLTLSGWVFGVFCFAAIFTTATILIKD